MSWRTASSERSRRSGWEPSEPTVLLAAIGLLPLACGVALVRGVASAGY